MYLGGVLPKRNTGRLGSLNLSQSELDIMLLTYS